MSDDKIEKTKPQVIDLDEADVIDVEAETVAPNFSRDADTVIDQTSSSRFNLVPWILGATLLGAVGGGWLYRDVLAGFFPNNEFTVMSRKLDAIEEVNKSSQEKLASLSALAQKLGSDIDAMESAAQKARADLDALVASNAGVSDKQAAAEQSLAEVTTAIAGLKSTLESTLANISTSPASSSPVDNAALATLATRVDGIEKDVEALKAQKSAAPDTSVLSQSLSDLKAKIANGAAYHAELDRIARLVPAAEGLDVLARHAAGLPNAQGLASELKAAIPTLPTAANPTPVTDDGYWSRITGFFSSIITIKNSGEPDWQSLATSLVATAEQGSLADAVAAVDAIDSSKPGAIAAFRDRAAARILLDEALAKTSDAVMRDIAAKAATP
jgi:archaellum component FlaC